VLSKVISLNISVTMSDIKTEEELSNGETFEDAFAEDDNNVEESEEESDEWSPSCEPLS